MSGRGAANGQTRNSPTNLKPMNDKTVLTFSSCPQNLERSWHGVAKMAASAAVRPFPAALPAHSSCVPSSWERAVNVLSCMILGLRIRPVLSVSAPTAVMC